MKAKIVSVIVFMCAAAFLPASGKELWAKSYLGKPAPKLVVEKWLTAEPNTRGKFVLIDFWATWCPPCRAAIPELNEIHRRFADKVCVIGISDEPEGKVRALKDPHIDYAVAIDTKERTKSVLEVRGIPHVLLVDPSGIVRWEGFPFLQGEELTPDVVQGIVEKYSKP